jgi:hypothetical protein
LSILNDTNRSSWIGLDRSFDFSAKRNFSSGARSRSIHVDSNRRADFFDRSIRIDRRYKSKGPIKGQEKSPKIQTLLGTPLKRVHHAQAENPLDGRKAQGPPSIMSAANRLTTGRTHYVDGSGPMLHTCVEGGQ